MDLVGARLCVNFPVPIGAHTCNDHRRKDMATHTRNTQRETKFVRFASVPFNLSLSSEPCLYRRLGLLFVNIFFF